MAPNDACRLVLGVLIIGALSPSCCHRPAATLLGFSGHGVRVLDRTTALVHRATMKVLFSSIRNTSHFLPLVPFIQACQRAGHEVAVTAPADLAERVAAVGAAFMPFGHPGDSGLAPLWRKMREVPAAEHPRVAVGEIFAGACAAAALPGMLETIETWRPAIVVRESHEYAALVAAEKLNVPHARVAISARGAEAEVAPFAAPHVDERRTSVGLPPDPSGARVASESVLTLFPPSFEPGAGAASARTLRFRAARGARRRCPTGGRGNANGTRLSSM